MVDGRRTLTDLSPPAPPKKERRSFPVGAAVFEDLAGAMVVRAIAVVRVIWLCPHPERAPRKR